MNTTLRDELLQRMERDQAVRTATPLGQPMTEQARQEWKQVDHDNTRFLQEVIAEHGWPGCDLVGDNASQAAWLLAQHADHDVAFQRRCLDLLQKAAAAGQAEPSHVAYLTDRVCVADGRPQLYGTQYHAPEGHLQPRPIDDPGHLDQRRAQMGLWSARRIRPAHA
ncbi:hypothetical protein GCM10022419_033040 [Nonomuraea rosea]|uniref:Uncharacterized protein n=1 Tax=Nonomuraea rosea TaxID=638574 RepID=A0ABP6WD90_9ACTN